jgi:hypothetical protein
MTKGVGWAKQAGLSTTGAGPLRWVVVQRAGGVEGAGIWSGPRAGKERERKRKRASGPTELCIGISAQKVRGNRKSLFIFKNLF